MLQSIIFDMDGTLFQTDNILELSLQETFDYLRNANLWEQETPIELYREIMGVPLPVVWEKLLPEHSHEIRQQSNDLFHEKLIANINTGNGALYPYTKEIFTYLKDNNCEIYIASNGQKRYLETIVNYYHLDNWVTETFSIEQIQSQNKSDLVRVILNKYNIKNGAVIGDRLSDIKAAQDNGFVSVGCNFDFAQSTELSQADFVINNLIDIKNVLETIQNSILGEKI